ncbi:SDR family NAD(P)-dependent oxidoreductase [Planotetraspora kaengkrachanensis]|uniref:3-oxoacyl-ACP reductase n=1 Tax=Planotetraspora kaengkrachanensis TaxID=575193 RepID=A0A8J3LRK7_9ACTN|nr:SDR family NAD(P)-dependent oxidoreductase [Planotetraspora kaengkrachanensis]GIG77903.1 3-oxoacyl-ACP reductase [Planotetraspora kaengkrachanensis]
MTGTDLAGRVALLTGASGGIGGALGRRLISAGVRTAFAYGTRAHEAGLLVAEARAAGLDAVALSGDLADPEVPARLVAETVDALGPVDLLIPNAGHAVRQAYTDVDLETWERTVAVNLRAPFMLAQQVMPAMVERGFGRVLFVSSIAAFTGGVVGPHYAASKAGLHGALHYLAASVAGHGVTVNAIAPALIEDTAMMPTTGQSPGAIPVGRFGRPEEVADLAMAMLRNGYLTNQVVSLDGGMHPR